MNDEGSYGNRPTKINWESKCIRNVVNGEMRKEWMCQSSMETIKDIMYEAT